MRGIAPLLVFAIIATAACQSPTQSTLTTGLSGIVLRGPVTPVCQVDKPCDGPFSADFIVERNGKQVGQFRSDSAGLFTVWLSPGVYRIIPGSDAPLIIPTSQAKQVEVGAIGLTNVRLEFDTGIR
jgi:hypothetical protein